MATETKDAWGNPLKYALKQAYRLVSALRLERITGVFIAKGKPNRLDAKTDVAFPSLPINYWAPLPYTAVNSLFAAYLGSSIEPPGAYVVPDPPPPPALDATLPVLNGNFGVSYYQNDLDVPVTMGATDNVAVLGYLITYTPTTPDPEAGFYPDPYTRFPLDPDKATLKTKIEEPNIWIYDYTIYGWAIDTSGNISLSRSSTFQVQGAVPFETPPALPPPAIPRTPTVDTFTLYNLTPSTLTVPITAFAGSSYVPITGYMITVDNSNAPLWNDNRWSATPSASVVFPSAGFHTVYAWVKDRVNQVSTAVSRDVTITLGPVPTYGSYDTIDGGKTSPYPVAYNHVYLSGLVPVSSEQTGSIDYTNGSWAQLTATWDKGRTERSLYAEPETGSQFDAMLISAAEAMSAFRYYAGYQGGEIHLGYAQKPSGHKKLIDGGRMIVMGAYREAFTKLGMPQITRLADEYGYPVGRANYWLAPAVAPQGLPVYDGLTWYCEGNTGAYIGGDKFIYTAIISAEVFVSSWGPYIELQGHPETVNSTPQFTINEQRVNHISASTPKVVGTSVTFFGDGYSTPTSYTALNDAVAFMNSKTATVSTFVAARGCIPAINSTIHTLSHGSPQTCDNPDCTYPYGHGDAAHSGEIVHYTINYNGVDYVYPYKVSKSSGYPMQWQLVLEGTLSSSSGMVVQSGVKACWPLALTAGWWGNDAYISENIAHPTITGTNKYATQVMIGGYLGNNVLYGNSKGRNTNAGGGLVSGYADASTGDTAVWSPDAGTTWYRVEPPNGVTDAQTAGGFYKIYPYGGYGKGFVSIGGKTYIFENGVLTLLTVTGYSQNGMVITINGQTHLSVASPASISFGQYLFAQSFADANTPITWQYLSSSPTTIPTYGKYIDSVASITCMAPGYKETWTPGSITIGGSAHNEISVANPLPYDHTIVMVTLTPNHSKSGRLLLLSDWGQAVYDAGYFNESIDAFGLVGDTHTGGAWGDWTGDGSIPGYIAPVIPPLTITSPDVLPAILATVQEYVTISVEGGIFPYMFTVTSGQLPANMTLDEVGIIEGVCVAPGDYSFTIQATDQAGTIASKAFTLKAV